MTLHLLSAGLNVISLGSCKDVRDTPTQVRRTFTNDITSYQNQKEVGEGISRAFKEFGIKREDVFIVGAPRFNDPCVYVSMLTVRLNRPDF